MSEGVFSKVHEGRGWRCPENGCKKFASLRVGSFFEGSNIPLTQLVEFLYFWAEGVQSTHFLTLNPKWSPNTITDWKNFFRDICVKKYLSNPEPIGGHGHIVEINESKFGKRKYHRGRQLSGNGCLVGLIE
ncbi:hypothetical protein LOD99_15595 [Oopsacas minuta]|uniref:Transposase n=1 Tax=Oopsacas minuta TaxID=111878 RepID=A0AAV7KA83_9METZ|nr:hypothetical protein LOD99_15595 [Oopsacas minuta]